MPVYLHKQITFLPQKIILMWWQHAMLLWTITKPNVWHWLLHYATDSIYAISLPNPSFVFRWWQCWFFIVRDCYKCTVGKKTCRRCRRVCCLCYFFPFHDLMPLCLLLHVETGRNFEFFWPLALIKHWPPLCFSFCYAKPCPWKSGGFFFLYNPQLTLLKEQ